MNLKYILILPIILLLILCSCGDSLSPSPEPTKTVILVNVIDGLPAFVSTGDGFEGVEFLGRVELEVGEKDVLLVHDNYELDVNPSSLENGNYIIARRTYDGKYYALDIMSGKNQMALCAEYRLNLTTDMMSVLPC
jgi:hypothetical protein